MVRLEKFLGLHLYFEGGASLNEILPDLVSVRWAAIPAMYTESH
jgi:hypothetical protein